MITHGVSKFQSPDTPLIIIPCLLFACDKTWCIWIFISIHTPETIFGCLFSYKLQSGVYPDFNLCTHPWDDIWVSFFIQASKYGVSEFQSLHTPLRHNYFVDNIVLNIFIIHNSHKILLRGCKTYYILLSHS